MVAFDLLQFAVAAVVICGLAVVVLEIVLTNPRWLWEIISDVRDFARRPARRPEKRTGKSAPASKGAASQDSRTSA